MPARPELLTYPGPMGENEARECGLRPTVLGEIDPAHTTTEDTKRAACELLARGVDLLLFAGGDGTARDIYDVVATRAPVVGIPTGCKIHSGVFAASPVAAGELARLFLEGRVRATAELEVLDIDEDAFRLGEVKARLYGFLRVPDERRLTQGAKAGGHGLTSEANIAAIAERLVEDMRPGRLAIIGSGTTPRGVMDRLGLPHTLLGIDVVRDGALVARDAGERELLDLLAQNAEAELIVTPIGGQGYIFGRGNQQLSPAVIRRVGLGGVKVVATTQKLLALPGQRIRADTGDVELDQLLRGPRRVITGYRETAMVELV
jgi:predicted polyphosphate/ATP-dependent NAD kinase